MNDQTITATSGDDDSKASPGRASDERRRIRAPRPTRGHRGRRTAPHPRFRRSGPRRLRRAARGGGHTVLHLPERFRHGSRVRCPQRRTCTELDDRSSDLDAAAADHRDHRRYGHRPAAGGTGVAAIGVGPTRHVRWPSDRLGHIDGRVDLRELHTYHRAVFAELDHRNGTAAGLLRGFRGIVDRRGASAYTIDGQMGMEHPLHLVGHPDPAVDQLRDRSYRVPVRRPAGRHADPVRSRHQEPGRMGRGSRAGAQRHRTAYHLAEAPHGRRPVPWLPRLDPRRRSGRRISTVRRRG